MPQSLTQTEATLALNLLPKVGPIRVRKLIEAFGSVERILQARPSEIAALDGFGNEIASIISSWEDHADIQAELRRANDLGISLVTPESNLYPPLLREIYDPPLLLYVLGELKENDRHALGVVGSRRATHYGLECARKLSFQLAHAGITIVSGLARGIDTAAHEAAVAAKGRTVAVIGSGLGNIYPPENQALAQRIADGHGAVVSEFAIDAQPDKQTFPMRNRLISGWSFGTLVVEAPARSGALITVNQALEQGRNIYAVPGPIDRPTSVGCNKLIQQGARLVLDGSDVLEEFDTLFPSDAAAIENNQPRPTIPLTDEENRVYQSIDSGETQIETIIRKSQLPAATVSATLLKLEMKHLVKQLPGNFFVKLV